MSPQLHPEAEDVLELREELGVLPYHSLSPEAAREQAIQQISNDAVPPEVDRVRDIEIRGPNGPIPLRLYEPDTTANRPIVVYFHGGGWVIGNLETHDAMCRQLARDTPAIVVSVDYRLAPEHPFPAPVEDCYAAIKWANEYGDILDGDPERLAVAGDSAGGNLAAATAILSRDRGGPDLAHQLLLYPVTDYSFDRPSYETYGTGYTVTKAGMVKFWDYYLDSDIDGANPYASPLRVPDLEGVAPGRVVTCEFDPLLDEGKAYADRLDEAGLLIDYTNIEDMFHGHLRMVQMMDRAEKDVAAIADELGRALN